MSSVIDREKEGKDKENKRKVETNKTQATESLFPSIAEKQNGGRVRVEKEKKKG
jgi:hypothetical protein